jgi:hypothetical protein
LKFYTCQIDQIGVLQGTVIPWQSLAQNAGFVDFTEGGGQGKSIAKVEHKSDGEYTTTTYFSAKEHFGLQKRGKLAGFLFSLLIKRNMM